MKNPFSAKSPRKATVGGVISALLAVRHMDGAPFAVRTAFLAPFRPRMVFSLCIGTYKAAKPSTATAPYTPFCLILLRLDKAADSMAPSKVKPSS